MRSAAIAYCVKSFVPTLTKSNPAATSATVSAAAPGVVALLRAVVQGAKTAGVEVGVCGELAGSVSGAKLLTEIGVFELSMDPAAVDEVREGLLGA